MTDGEKLKHIRNLLQLTQGEMSDKLGLSQQALSHLENNRNTEMSFGVFKNLVNNLGVNPYLFLKENEPVFIKKNGSEENLRKKLSQYDHLIDKLVLLRKGK